MTEHNEIANVVARWFAAVDRRHWTAAEALMTAPFHLDYSSFGGGPAANRKPGDVLAAWAGFLPGFDATHHQLGNLDIRCKEQAAVVSCYVTASHFIASAANGPVWVVVGTYELSLIHDKGMWLLSSCRFDFKYQDGNTALPALAQQRLA